MDAEERTENVLNALWQLTKKSYSKRLRKNGLMEKLIKLTGIEDDLDVREALAVLSRKKLIEGVTNNGVIYQSVTVIARPTQAEISPRQARWLELIADSDITDRSRQLGALAEKVEDLCDEDMVALLNAIKKLLATIPDANEDPALTSARNLLGSSKILSAIVKAIGLPDELMMGAVTYVVVAGPSQPEAALFIENPASFEVFCASQMAQRMMGISTFGYGLRWNNIAEYWGDSRIKSLVRQGAPPPIGSINNIPCFYWGDLDKAGLDIYIKLKRKIRHLQLSALYSPMAAKLKSRESSHPYCVIADKAGKHKDMAILSSHPAVRELLQLCDSRAVDQEIIEQDEVELLGMHAFRED